MKVTLLLCFVTIASAVYTDMDETIDMDAVVADPEKLRPYMNCFLDKEPCTAQAAAYKKHLIDILSNACNDCDDRLKHMVEEFLLNVMAKYPTEMVALRAKYDPNNARLPGLVLEVSKY